jgi:hypothetical protein
VLTLRRGLLAAGLAVSVVSALSVASVMNAEAAEPAPAAEPATAKPPALLPWGERPSKIRTGPAGASSDSLRAAGLTAAPDTDRPAARNAPKGRVNGAPVTTLAAEAQYFYNVGTQVADSDGYSANVTVARPTLGAADYHTLAELAVQSADSRQIVEVGWTVDRALNGDSDPHLFVYHWINGAPACYNGCGFVPTPGATVKPGATLAAGVSKRFGIQFSEGAWWISFDNEFIGHFPETLWTSQGVGSFNRSGLVQIFGEVAAGGEKPCSQMGNGLPGTDPAAAVLGSVTYLDGPTVALAVKSTTTYYTVGALSGRTFQYGGTATC